MLQVARLAPQLLGDSSDLVRSFFLRQLGADGGGMDREGQPDVYYTIFVLAGLQTLQCAFDHDAVVHHLRESGARADIDLIHLGALARCWGSVGVERAATNELDGVIARIEARRCEDGGYDAEVNASRGNAYGCFVALGAYQDLQREMPQPLRMLHCLQSLETDDGAWANVPGLKDGSTNATAAAVTILRQLNVAVPRSAAEWLLARQHPSGGFLASPTAPLPDLLSTATTLHALARLECELSGEARERCLDFVDSLWNAAGGFHGHWADDHLDAEYTFYGLLALGHLAALR
jgi:prenyltransferase beta subunit